MSGRRLLMAVSAALALTAAGCSGSSGSKAAPSATSAASAATASSTTSQDSSSGSTADGQGSKLHHVAPTAASNALAAKLIASIPGYKLQPDSVGDTGPSDLNKAVDDDGAADARTELVNDRFVVGYQRMFAITGKRAVVVFVYRFATPGGAQRYNARSQAARSKPDGGSTPKAFAVSGIPGALGLAAAGNDGSSNHVVLFAKGVYVAELVTMATSPATDTGPTAAQLALQQFNML